SPQRGLRQALACPAADFNRQGRPASPRLNRGLHSHTTPPQLAPHRKWRTLRQAGQRDSKGFPASARRNVGTKRSARVTNYVCDPQSLERFVQQICVAVGSDDDIAAEVAHHLVRANLSGHDSHGVLRLPWYAEQIKKGDLQPNARPTIIREMGATAVMDAHHGFGQYTTYVG